MSSNPGSSMLHNIIAALPSNGERSLECLRQLDLLPSQDLARPDLRAAAQAFALLAIADALARVRGEAGDQP